jgi:hypothetical protein
MSPIRRVLSGSLQHFSTLQSVLLLSLAACGPAYAAGDAQAPHEYGVSAGVVWSDNIAPDSGVQRSGEYSQVGVTYRQQEQTARLKANIDLNVVEQHYFDNEYSDGFLGGVDADAKLALVPERLSWVLRENYGQTRRSVFNANTPANRQNFNYLTTGPDGVLPVSADVDLTGSATYSRATFEQTALNSNRYNAQLGVAEHLNPGSVISLNANSEHLEYSGSNLTYDRESVFGRYDTRGPRSAVTLDLGASHISYQGTAKTGLLLDLTAQRQISEYSTLRLNVNSGFSDSANTFRGDQAANGVKLDPGTVVATSDAFHRDSANGSWNFIRNRTRLALYAAYNRERYETLVGFDRSVIRVGLQVSRQIMTKLRFTIDGNILQEKYDSSGFRSRQGNGSAEFQWDFSRTLAMTLGGSHVARTVTEGATGYGENRAYLFISYSPRGNF